MRKYSFFLRTISYLVLLFLLITPAVKAELTSVPTDWNNFTFNPYTLNGQSIYDHQTSADPTNGGAAVQPDSIDIASCSQGGGSPGSEESVLIAFYDADGNPGTINDAWIAFRLRLAADPTESGKGGVGYKSAHWDFLIDVDNDGYKEFVIDVDGGYASSAIDVLKVYYNNSNVQTIDPVNDLVTSFYAAGRGATGTEASNSHVRAVEDTLNSCGRSNNYWIDVQIPFSAFNISGTQHIDTTSAVRVFYSTSASNSDPLQKDWMTSNGDNSSGGCGTGTAFGDYFSGTTGGVVPLKGGIVGKIYEDSNANGVYDSGGESLLSGGATLNLKSINTLQTFSTTSDINGAYSFSGLEPDTYTLEVSVAGYAATGSSTIISTLACSSNITNDFGFASGGSLFGTIFYDADADGVFDENETKFSAGGFGDSSGKVSGSITPMDSAIDSNDNVYILSDNGDGTFKITKFDAAGGAKDVSFGTSGEVTVSISGYPFVSGIGAIAVNGTKVVVVATTGSKQTDVLQYTSAGVLDTTASSQLAANPTINAYDAVSDGTNTYIAVFPTNGDVILQKYDSLLSSTEEGFALGNPGQATGALAYLTDGSTIAASNEGGDSHIN